MPAPAGSLTHLAQFSRAGAGGFEPMGQAQWCAVEFERLAWIEMGTMRIPGRSARLTIRQSDLARGLKAGDRATVHDVAFSVLLKRLPMNSVDDVTVEVESVPTFEGYLGEFMRKGTTASLQRAKPGGWDVAKVRAVITGFAADDLVGDIQQGERVAVILASDVDNSTFPGPPRQNDKLRVRGVTLNVMSVDADTHRLGDDLFAYAVVVKGPQLKGA